MRHARFARAHGSTAHPVLNHILRAERLLRVTSHTNCTTAATVAFAASAVRTLIERALHHFSRGVTKQNGFGTQYRPAAILVITYALSRHGRLGIQRYRDQRHLVPDLLSAGIRRSQGAPASENAHFCSGPSRHPRRVRTSRPGYFGFLLSHRAIRDRRIHKPNGKRSGALRGQTAAKVAP